MKRKELEAALSKPLMDSGCGPSVDEFDPWGDIIKGIYGNYNASCDILFIEALKAVRDGTQREYLNKYQWAGELTLHTLAGHGLTDYGTSPRGAWPDWELKDLWDNLIEKWIHHYELHWEEPYPYVE